jgi:hypothetical protein
MARPSEPLSSRLERAHAAGPDGIVKGAAISRRDREVLQSEGWLTPICRGWYLLQAPGARDDDSTAWSANIWTFTRVYLTDRFGQGWCLSAEASLRLLTGDTTVPSQLVVIASRGGSMLLQLPQHTSLLLYSDPDRLPRQVELVDGVRLMQLPEALLRVSLPWFRTHPTTASIALGMIRSAADLARAALDHRRVDGVGRLAGALRAMSRPDAADELLEAVESAGHAIVETDPFETPPPRRGSPVRSPQASRLAAMWQRMRTEVIALWPPPPPKVEPDTYLADLDARAERDAWHSLSIEGYRVTPELIGRISRGDWRPDQEPSDASQRDALAAAGYLRAHREVRAGVAGVLAGEAPGLVASRDMARWYRALFSPHIEAGLVRPSDLLGYRRQAVFIRGSRHVPPPHSTVVDCMEELFDVLRAEPSAAARAVLGHFAFTWVHPYPDGNGRLGRFLMNLQLASAGYPWTVIQLERCREYMSALEVASVAGDIGPFVSFVKQEMEVSADSREAGR